MTKTIQFIIRHGKYRHLLFCRRIHQYTVSELFQPLHVRPKDAIVKEESTSLSQKLLVDCGVINCRSNGMFALLPLGQRVITKLMKVIDEEMKLVGAQKMLLPLLTSGQLWRATGRWESTGQELMKVQDRHNKDYVLSPTHEEAITNLVSEVYPLSHRQLPLSLYQITSKFRDEMKPRFGLLRCKEFMMKDLYTFDSSEEAAVTTYNKICGAYDRVFQRIGVPFLKVAGDCGNIGGSFSHEYHYQAAIGEDTLLLCEACGVSTNAELVTNSDDASCDKCGNHMTKTAGIEVGHTFLLGTKYSGPLKASYQNEKGKPELLQMGCYGLGVSRIMAATVEVLSQGDCIRWPWVLAPFKVCLISPKKGSKEASAVSWVAHLADVISSIPGFEDDVIVDDRDTLTIGKRVMKAKEAGYPLIIVVGKAACQDIPLFEVINTKNNDSQILSHKLLSGYLREISREQ
ncbi:probable proline--tRNA ligase, mitochondrial [Homarus americanus]|uniref:probable proline--tRNA ligase, mitochondrial n=1 Tax=Homarus americanus TaxID=6706 RepID=UPI001C43E065|nr:probable proline--tRNA ligase, mitochondrial [Homarus americanus]